MTLRPKGSVALLLCMALVLSTLPVSLAVSAPSGIAGRVFREDLVTPAANLGVKAIPDGAKDVLAEARTDAKGRFALAGLPAGAYLLLLTDPKGTPLAATRLTTRVGERSDLTLALPDQTPGQNPAAPGQSQTPRVPWISTTLGATVVLVGAAIVLVAGAKSVTDNDKSPGQPPVSEGTR